MASTLSREQASSLPRSLNSKAQTGGYCRDGPTDLVGFQLLHDLESGPIQVWCALQGKHLAENVPEAFKAEVLLIFDGVPGVKVLVDLACAPPCKAVRGATMQCSDA